MTRQEVQQLVDYIHELQYRRNVLTLGAINSTISYLIDELTSEIERIYNMIPREYKLENII